MTRHPAFVLAMGRSGTLWLARTLRETAGLDARHESTEMCRDMTNLPMGAVEVNSFLWDCVPFIRKRWSNHVVLVHLVRDGRNVVRSMMGRYRRGRTFEGCCEEWAKRNRLLADEIPGHQRFRLEDLTSNWSEYRRLVRLVGGGRSPDATLWEQLRKRRDNATDRHMVAPYRHWPPQFQREFKRICAKQMRRMGYRV